MPSSDLNPTAPDGASRPFAALLSTFAKQAKSASVFWISIALLILVVFFAVVTPHGTFLSVFNAQTLAGDASVLLVLATAGTLVIVAGGLDLSLGSVMTCSEVAAIVAMHHLVAHTGNGWLTIFLGLGCGMLTGMAWGALNGVLIAYARLPAFVVTLGSLGSALGVARLLSDGATQSGAPPALQSDIGLALPLGIPLPFLIGLAFALFFTLVMALMRFGEHLYLVGSNEEAARRGGIATRWLQFRIYVFSGLLAGIAGLVDLARFDAADISTGHTNELLAGLAAVIIGGASLLGGVGVIPGSIVGVFIPVVLNNGFVILGIQPFWHDIVVGVILVAAVALDQWRRTAAVKAPGRRQASSSGGPTTRGP